MGYNDKMVEKKDASGSGFRQGKMIRGHLAWLVCVMLAGCIPPQVVQYTSFHERDFSQRNQPATLQQKPAAELLNGGYLLIGYLDLRRNVRTCYEDGQCVAHSDPIPSNDDLLSEAASRGGDVVSLLDERTVIEQRDKSICTNTYTTVIMVNNAPQVSTHCSAYRTIPGKIEARISRALIWRLDPEAARGEANAHAIDVAMKTLEAAYREDEAKTTVATGSTLSGAAKTSGQNANMDELSREIYRAIGDNDTRQLYRLARDGKLQAWKGDNDRSALMTAISADRFDAALTLLAIDRGLDRRDSNGYSAVNYAAARGNLSLLQELIKAGYDVRQKSTGGASLLFSAIYNPNQDNFQWLLGQGLDPKERTKQDETLLMAAAAAGQPKSIERLIALGLDVNQGDQNGATALMYAAYRGQLPAMQALLKAKARLDVVDTDGNTPLHNAAAGGQRDMLQLLLQRGVQINAEDKKGRSPLISAMADGKWDAAHYLLGRGARLTTSKISAEDMAGYLISKNQPEILRRYLVAYPPLKELMQRDPNWLQYAAKSSGGETIKFLVDLGARIDHPGSDGLTPLLTACSEGNQETTRALLELKADPGRRNQRNQTALKIATLKGYPKIVATLREFHVKE